jgi:hypothetical protein
MNAGIVKAKSARTVLNPAIQRTRMNVGVPVVVKQAKDLLEAADLLADV